MKVAAHIPLPILKQSKINRVWRLLRRNKRFSSLSFWHALSNLIFQLTKTNLILIDFTSFPFRGRSIPFYARVLRKQDIDEKYPSQMDRNVGFIFRLPRGRRSKWRIFQMGAISLSWKKLKVCIKQKKDDPWILVCPFDLFFGRRSFQMAMQQEQSHRELKSRFGMLDFDHGLAFKLVDRACVEGEASSVGSVSLNKEVVKVITDQTGRA